MTGYGRVQQEHQGWQITVELRSVNHRGLDVRVTAPPSLLMVEPGIRQAVRRHCVRGRVECRLSVRPNEKGSVGSAAVEHAERLFGALKTIKKSLDLPGSIELSDLLEAGLDPLPSQNDEDLGWLAEEIVHVTDKALGDLVEAREAEGAVLVADFENRTRLSAELIEKIAVLTDATQDVHRERLMTRVNDTLQQLQGSTTVDETRLLQELAIVLDKADITEELVRARSHTELLSNLFSAGNPAQEPIGKRVDFFLQELAREANTMASKSCNAELTSEIVALKSEIERMREQAHNLE